MPGYTITDPRPIADANPFSFYRPCDARLAAIAPGDHVKAIFAPTDEDEGTERMWVLVTAADADTLTGTLDNEPFGMTGIALGDVVTLKRTDVIAIETTRADDPAETNGVGNEHLFHRCAMDDRVYRDKAQPTRIVRDAAQPEGYGPANGDAYPWGGWRILGEGFEDRMDMEIGTPIIAVRIDARLAPLFDAPAGSAFELVDGEWREAA